MDEDAKDKLLLDLYYVPSWEKIPEVLRVRLNDAYMAICRQHANRPAKGE